jgi:hypothetical protein
MKKGKLRVLDDGSTGFKCPGCGYWHLLPVRPTENRPSWEFNGDYDKPTFSPSILMTTWESISPTEKRDVRCHSFVTDGKIQFLSDCTHKMAGQTVDLPDLKEGD